MMRLNVKTELLQKSPPYVVNPEMTLCPHSIV